MAELFSRLSPRDFMSVGLYYYAAALTAVLLVGVLLDGTHDRLFMRAYLGVLLSEMITLLCEAGILLLDGHPEHIISLRVLVFSTFFWGVTLTACYSVCAVAFMREYKPIPWCGLFPIAVVCIIYLMLVLVSAFNGFLFYVDASGNYHDGPFYFLVNIMDISLLLMVLLLIWYHCRELSISVSLMSFSFIPLCAMPLMLYLKVIPFALSTPMALLWTFLLFHRHLNVELAEKERLLSEKERQLTQMHIATMISQIQPHFIYNTLGSIHQLCLDQPEQAAQLTLEFSQYLRGSLGELNVARPISILKEMEHVRHYVHIEEVRFPDITVQFDLRCTSFQLPALSVQPLVENAIKHGVRGLDSGGTVRISSFETETDYCVCIQDDGIGFDPSAPAQDGKLHVGIPNIRSRLEEMCGGTLTINSAPGKGTIATIKIPKEENL